MVDSVSLGSGDVGALRIDSSDEVEDVDVMDGDLLRELVDGFAEDAEVVAVGARMGEWREPIVVDARFEGVEDDGVRPVRFPLAVEAEGGVSEEVVVVQVFFVPVSVEGCVWDVFVCRFELCFEAPIERCSFIVRSFPGVRGLSVEEGLDLGGGGVLCRVEVERWDVEWVVDVVVCPLVEVLDVG